MTLFTDLTGTVLPEIDSAVTSHETEHLLQAVVGGITLVGVFLAFLFYLKKPTIPAAIKATPVGAWLSRFWLSGWGFDTLYDRLFVRPFVGLARVLQGDPFDGISSTLGRADRGRQLRCFPAPRTAGFGPMPSASVSAPSSPSSSWC